MMLHIASSPALVLSPGFHVSRSRPVFTAMLETESATDDWRAGASLPAVCKYTDEELAAMKEIGGDFANVYGEITERGFAELGSRLSLGPDDVFVDAGSGQGSVVMQAVREFDVRRSIGVEYASSRHDRAVARLACEPSSTGVASRVSLIQGDCADVARWTGAELSACTCLYTCNLLFDEALNARLKQCVECCPRIRCVASFREWPDGLAGFSAPYEVRCETSWSPLKSTFTRDPVLDRMVADGGTTLYVYERTSLLDSVLQRAATPEVSSVLAALAVARIIQVLRQYFGEF